jgi:hypothetical protein
VGLDLCSPAWRLRGQKARHVGPDLCVDVAVGLCQEESRYSEYKSAPCDLGISMAAEEKGKTPPVVHHPDCDKYMTQEYYDRYKAQSQELYTFLSRSFHDVFKFCEQPYQFGTHMSGSSVKAVPGDVVTAIFIILDLNEKTGWTERNTKREFFGHIDVFFGSEKSIKKAVKSVRNRIPDAKRIGVKIDYEIIRRCAIQLQRRDVCFIPITSRYLKADAAALGYEHDALTQLNIFLSEIAQACDEYHIDTVNANMIDSVYVDKFNACAVTAFGADWNRGNQPRRTGGGSSADDGGGGSADGTVCCKKGCKKKLQSSQITQAKNWVADHPDYRTIDYHRVLCKGCYDTAVRDGKTTGIEIKNGRPLDIATNSKRYKACAARISKADDKPATAESEPASPGVTQPPLQIEDKTPAVVETPPSIASVAAQMAELQVQLAQLTNSTPQSD